MARSDQAEFDGYRKWLGIPKERQPPNFYQLLAISLDEDDLEVIRAAVEQRRSFVESKRGEGHEAAVNEILYQINEAEFTLLNSEMRRDYDRRMGLFEKRKRRRQVDPNAARGTFESRPGRSVGEDSGIVRTFVGVMAVLGVGCGLIAWFSFQLPWWKPVNKANAGATPAPAITETAAPTAPAVVQRSPDDAVPDADSDAAAANPEPVAQVPIPEVSEFEGWRFYDVFNKGLGPNDAFTVAADGMLVCRNEKGKPAFCLATAQEFSDYTLRLEFLFRSDDLSGNPFVSVASTLPQPNEAKWERMIPYGIEVKLQPGFLGKIVLPSADFRADLPFGQLRDERQVAPLRKPELKMNDWNTLEVICDEFNNVTVKINVTTVNALAKAENTEGHIVIWPPQAEMRVRNAVIIRDGVETKLSFKKWTAAKTLRTRLAGTKWLNSRNVSFVWTQDGKFLHNGKEREWKVLSGNKVEVVFGPDHVDTLVFDEEFTEFKQLIKGGPESFQGKRR